VKKFKQIMIAILVLALLGFGVYFFVGAENRNKISRLGVTGIAGDYTIEYTQGNQVKTYKLHGKVSSSPNGYYYFWIKTDTGKKYVQLPIAHTSVEEM